MGLSRYRGHIVAHHAGGVPGFSSFYGRIPDDDLSAIVLSNRGRFDAAGLAGEIANHALDLPMPMWQPTDVSSGQLSAAEGIYANHSGDRLEVARLGERLALRSGMTGMLVPIGDHTFALTEAPDTRVRFEAPYPDGRYTRAMVVKPFYWYIVERASDGPTSE